MMSFRIPVKWREQLEDLPDLVLMLCCIALMERIPLTTVGHLPDELVYGNALSRAIYGDAEA